MFDSLPLARLLAGCTLAACLCSCESGRELRPASTLSPDTRNDTPLFGSDPGPPDEDAEGLCGNQIHKLITDAPNLYFVFDASRSMSVPVAEGEEETRYEAVRNAVLKLLRNLGPLVNVGATLFPEEGEDACETGAQVMAMTPGDPKTGVDGPTIKKFAKETDVNPAGSTPLAATLRAVSKRIETLSGKNHVIIATDGGPNCNPNASCPASECIPNIEEVCEPNQNCCAANNDGPIFCLDVDASFAAVTDLKAKGAEVYVIAVQSKHPYVTLLEQLGNVAKNTPDETRFFPVNEVGSLFDVFSVIAERAVSCSFVLESDPQEGGYTNVYLDKELLPQNEENGWVFIAENTVELRGEPCDQLKNGAKTQVQIVSGCPSEPPK